MAITGLTGLWAASLSALAPGSTGMGAGSMDAAFMDAATTGVASAAGATVTATAADMVAAPRSTEAEAFMETVASTVAVGSMEAVAGSMAVEAADSTAAVVVTAADTDKQVSATLETRTGTADETLTGRFLFFPLATENRFLNADAFIGWLWEVLRKPKGIGRGAVRLVMLEAFAAFGDGGNVACRYPPEAVAGLSHLLEPLGAIAKDAGVIGFIRVIPQRFDALPHGHIDDHKRVIIVGDVCGVAGARLQAPDKTRRRIGQGIDGLELSDEFGNPGIVNRRNQSSDIDLREMVVHGWVPP